MSPQGEIQTLLDKLVNEGRERGMQVAAYHNGKLIIDAWAGVADRRTGATVNGDTLFPVFSTTKGIATTIIHMLVDKGRLSYETRISELWPEFAEHGKEGITVRHALNHTAGVTLIPAHIGHAELCNWDRMCDELAHSAPQWKPGTRMEYHAITFGWLLGEVARRADGRHFQDIVRDDICAALGIRDIYVGIPDSVVPLVAFLEDPETVPPVPPVTPKPQSIPDWLIPLGNWMNRADAQRACIPASNGIMSARAVARHYAALVPGGVDGVALLTHERVTRAVQHQTPDNYHGEELPMTIGLGYYIGAKDSVMGSRASAFGHSGYGGSTAFADPEYGLAIAITKNLISKNNAVPLVARAVRDVLHIPQ